LVEGSEIIGQALVRNLIQLLNQYDLKKNITYMKDEGANLNAMTTI
jgi:hypothetical protein